MGDGVKVYWGSTPKPPQLPIIVELDYDEIIIELDYDEAMSLHRCLEDYELRVAARGSVKGRLTIELYKVLNS